MVDKDDDLDFVCEYCGKRFATYDELKQHRVEEQMEWFKTEEYL